MTLRTRIFLVYLLLIGGGYVYLFTSILGAIRPRYLESMEATLIDTAAYLAAIAETHVTPEGELHVTPLRQAFDAAVRRPLDAQVYTFHKTSVDLRVYLTDSAGVVIYDSNAGRDEGLDYARWNDVRRTLDGRYGARATRLDPGEEDSLVIHVAAPIRHGDRIVGVLSVGKPTANINALVAAVRTRVLFAGALGGGLVLAAGLAFSIWIITPLEKLTAYARAIRDGHPATLPTRLAGREVGDLRRAFEEMRAALEGKAYVERYTQSLAHEIKAPLAAIRGAAELLSESTEMPAPQRARFLQNLRTESGRIQTIVDKLLQLAALENRRSLADPSPVDLRTLLREGIDAIETIAQSRRLHLTLNAPDAVTISGESFLLAQAVSNLLQNALEFTPEGGEITITLRSVSATAGALILIEDTGPGIPDYALPRLFERFYSLPHPATGAKSTGLGLSFVREIAHLHHGEITLENRPTGGTRATLLLARPKP
ncbi:MAG: two-component system sensor histidine kinase CreC [Burkholderiales bacterium]|nr:two-component system sensor histidine kinase CreC [Opitutaceae bacterium]